MPRGTPRRRPLPWLLIIPVGAVAFFLLCTQVLVDANLREKEERKRQEGERRVEEARVREANRPTHLFCFGDVGRPWTRRERTSEYAKLPEIDGEYCAGTRAQFTHSSINGSWTLDASWEQRPTGGGHTMNAGRIILRSKDGFHYRGSWTQHGDAWEQKGSVLNFTCVEESCHGVAETDPVQRSPTLFMRISLEPLP